MTLPLNSLVRRREAGEGQASPGHVYSIFIANLPSVFSVDNERVFLPGHVIIFIGDKMAMLYVSSGHTVYIDSQ